MLLFHLFLMDCDAWLLCVTAAGAGCRSGSASMDCSSI